MQINFIFTYNVYILCLSCNVKMSKQLLNYLKKALFQYFQWCPLPCLHLYCYRFLSSHYINQVPEKLYFGQWPYIAKIDPVNVTTQIEPVQDKNTYSLDPVNVTTQIELVEDKNTYSLGKDPLLWHPIHRSKSSHWLQCILVPTIKAWQVLHLYL